MNVEKKNILDLLFEIRKREELSVSRELVEKCYLLLESNQFSSDTQTHKLIRDLIIKDVEKEMEHSKGVIG